ncbi:lantibiotic dehydratase [Streptomyces antimicrobicus]|uniref:lantibiotic dehydratase n=1 Tax=Streptomyces antimicrobicus TaxID=2883108 RepID=UPI0027DEBEDF|nr:lantibiotic dehydratase [Streptomyces antimicrobicus]
MGTGGVGTQLAPAPVAGVGGRGPAYQVRTAPYALVRATVLRHPPQQPPADRFRVALAALTRAEHEEAALLPGLCDALYASRDSHGRTFHHDVVLPLRRALHNGRTPPPALLTRLDDLPTRVPSLAAWLSLRARRSSLLTELERLAQPALTAERALLAALCREPALGRAVALISPDLLRAVERTAAGADDRRARKEEPAVLRYALRASTKTSPLSWFTAVGWGALPAGTNGVADTPAGHAEAGSTVREQAGLHEASFAPVVRVNRALVAALVAALAEDPARRDALLYRMTSTARRADGRAAYARVRHRFTGGRHISTTEEEVTLPATTPLALLHELTDPPHPLATLSTHLTTALRPPHTPSPPAHSPAPPLTTPATPTPPQQPASPAPATSAGPAPISDPASVAPGATAPAVTPALAPAVTAAQPPTSPAPDAPAPARASGQAVARASAQAPATATAPAPGPTSVAPGATAPAPAPASGQALATAPAPAAGTTGGGPADAYLARLLAAGLLVPADPVCPQDPDPLASLATWLRTPRTTASAASAPPPEPLADRLDEIRAETQAFAARPARQRPAALARLTTRWRDLLADAGRPLPLPDSGGGSGPARLDVLTEDAVAPRPLDLSGFLGGADHTALAELTALAETFDLGHVMRRVALARFVARYGRGGTCPHPWEFGADIAEAWEEAGRLTAQDPAAPDGWPADLAPLAELRRTVTEAVRAEARRTPPGATEVLLPPDLLPGLGPRLPSWARERPTSYAYFVQRDNPYDSPGATTSAGTAARTTTGPGTTAGPGPGPGPTAGTGIGAPDGPGAGLLCVNHIYGGWGRFTSRFLDAMDPAATHAVSDQIRTGLGPGARAAAVRPVGGFNANLHPLLVPDEIGPDRRWTTLAESDVDLVHDLASDQLRLRLRGTGELLDVLYAGFLAPVMLPGRLAPYLCDHPAGVVDLRALAPADAVEAPGGQVLRTARLRHRHLVLHRRSWYLDAATLARLRADLEAERPLPITAVARWRALLDLPDQVFLRPALPGTDPGKFAEAFVAGLRRPKPQVVDLGSALHLRNLAKWLTRHTDGAVLEEALPAPGGRDRATRAVELVVETYREGRPHR